MASAQMTLLVSTVLRARRAFPICAAFALLGGIGIISSAGHADPITPFIYGQRLPHGNANEPWETTPWTGSETEYVRAQTTIDNEVANGFSLTGLESKYDSKAKRSPENPVAQFARAYFYEQCILKYFPVSQSIEDDILSNLTRTDPDHIYEFTRERFIFTVICDYYYGDIRYLYPLGQRLLAHDQEDFDVNLQLYKVISLRKELIPQGLRIAKELVKKYPNQPKAHLALAEAYWAEWSWGSSDNIAICEQSISEFETYLKMADPADPAAKSVPFTIKAMQGYMSGEYKWEPSK